MSLESLARLSSRTEMLYEGLEDVLSWLPEDLSNLDEETKEELIKEARRMIISTMDMYNTLEYRDPRLYRSI